MEGDPLQSIYWRRQRHLHLRLVEMEARISLGVTFAAPMPEKSASDIIGRASRLFGLLAALLRILILASPFLLIAWSMISGWIKQMWHWVLAHWH